MNQLENLALVRWSLRHPRLAAWIGLAAGMVILLLIEVQSEGLTAGNWIALMTATVLVAGACVWIISWEDRDEEIEPSETSDTGQSK
ncbi:MAG: hypothetical protein H6672_06255 [Anaerolineaceae bacterium]|nr:hypothetical protein [Anaerolineaceae bacterium]